MSFHYYDGSRGADEPDGEGECSYWCEGPTCRYPGVSQTVSVEGSVCERCQEFLDELAGDTVVIPAETMRQLRDGGAR